MDVPKNKKKQEQNAATPQTTTAMNTKTRGFYVTFILPACILFISNAFLDHDAKVWRSSCSCVLKCELTIGLSSQFLHLSFLYCGRKIF